MHLEVLRIIHNGVRVTFRQADGGLVAIRNGVESLIPNDAEGDYAALVQAVQVAFPYDGQPTCDHSDSYFTEEERENCKGEKFKRKVLICPGCGYRSG